MDAIYFTIYGGIILFLLWCFVILPENKTRKLIGFIVVYLFWGFGMELGLNSQKSTSKIESQVLVSVNPSEGYMEGNFSIGLFRGHGSLETERWYLLREEIQEGLYKDFTVKKEVFIEERDNLPKGRGFFEKEFSCRDISYSLRLVVWEWSKIKKKCEYLKQTIVVPKGYVIKDLSI